MTRPRPARDVHCSRYDEPSDRIPGGHRLSRQCPCGVVAYRDLAEPSRVVWVHRTPPLPTPKRPGWWADPLPSDALPEPQP